MDRCIEQWTRPWTPEGRELETDRLGGEIVEEMLFGSGISGDVYGSATATGRGLAELIGAVIAAGSCTATGRGTVEIDAVVLAIGSAEATGLGTAQLVAAVIAAGVAAATGRGTTAIIVSVTVSASAAATGHGAASCIASVQEPGPSATATGRGFASCRLTQVLFDPLARHSGTRTVRAGCPGVRSVARVHSATRGCGSEDERLCGARRLN